MAAPAPSPSSECPSGPSVAGPDTPSAFRLSIPVAMGYIPLGMAFGFLMAQAGAVWWIAPVMSILVYAGAAQFMVVPMLAAGETLAAIAVATLVVNLRHIFYGLSVLDRLPESRWGRAYLAAALTDESYSLITTLPPHTPTRTVLGIAALNHGWWVLGSLIGSVIGAALPPTLKGFDFSLAALFAILVVGQWRTHRQLAPLVTAIISYPLALWLMPSQALLLAIGFSVAAGVLLGLHRKPSP